MDENYVEDFFGDIWFGNKFANNVDWRQFEDDEDPDDELLVKTPDDVLGMLGFDPRELDEKPVKGLSSIFIKGGPGSGSWEGPGAPRFAYEANDGSSEYETAKKYIDGISNTEMAKDIRDKFLTKDFFGKGGITGLAKEQGLTVEEYQVKVEKFLKDKLEKTSIAIRVNEIVLIKILNDGKIKSQFETGRTGSGKTVSQKQYDAERTQYEKKAYAMDENTPVSDHPIYGYYSQENDKNNSFLEGYGKISLVLNNDVKNRSTFTDSDSLDLNYSNNRFYPSPANNPSIYSTYGISNNTEVIEANTKHVTYWEAQIFGGVKISDIAKVKFYTEPSDKILSKLDKVGIKYEVVK